MSNAETNSKIEINEKVIKFTIEIWLLQNQARFSIEEAQEVLFWIEHATNMQFDKDPSIFETAQDVADALKDGVLLCVLALLPHLSIVLKYKFKRYEIYEFVIFQMPLKCVVKKYQIYFTNWLKQ